MSIHIIHLTGCTPSPLASYLKALAVLRLVNHQKDKNARLWWQNEHAVLVSELDKEALLEFFSEQYMPTPIIAPWNGGSGFYAKDNTKAIEAIMASDAPRFAVYKEAITTAQKIIADMGLETQPKDEAKANMIAHLKRTLRGATAEWLSAVAILTDENDPKFPSLLGTGGNDGRLEFTNNYMQRLGDLFDLSTPEAAPFKTSHPLLESSLFGHVPAAGLQNSPIGFYSPGAAGGPNSSNGFSGDSKINPWDYLLMLEGAIIFSTGIVRKCNTEELPHGSAPFEVYSDSIGYGGATANENSRGEQWMPLWATPASYAEVSELFEQGRIQLGAKTAQRPSEIARAISRFGATRGITAFERYGYLERNGLAYLAISLGRWNVSAQAHQEVVDHAAKWLEDNARASRERESNKLKSLYHSASEALMSVLKNATPERWEILLIALGDYETALAETASGDTNDYTKPLNDLPAEWLKVLNLDSPEMRLALSLANAIVTDESHEKAVTSSTKDSVTNESKDKIGEKFPKGYSLRGYMLPLGMDKTKSYWITNMFDKGSIEWAAKTGRFLLNAKSILRRLMLQMQNSVFPLKSQNRCYPYTKDICAFLNGDLNDDKIWALTRPLMALNWKKIDRRDISFARINQSVRDLPAIFALMRLAFPTERIIETMPSEDVQNETHQHEYLIPSDSTTLNLLLSGNVKAASQKAIRRLISSGLRPNIQFVVADPNFALRIAASLLFPLDGRTLGNLVSKICRPTLTADELSEQN